jgi:hypothetical protein
LVISQWDRLACAFCAAAFKLLLCLHLDGIFPSLSGRILGIPYYIAALLHLVLHYRKTPLKEKCSRPGSPVTLVPVVAMLVCLQIDGVLGVEWKVILLPLCFICLILSWNMPVFFGNNLSLSFGLAGVCTLLFLSIVVVFTTLHTLGTSLFSLALLLDLTYTSGVSYDAVLVPLIAFCSVVLACYIAAVAVLSRMHDEAKDENELPTAAQGTRAAESVLPRSRRIFPVRRGRSSTEWREATAMAKDAGLTILFYSSPSVFRKRRESKCRRGAFAVRKTKCLVV